MSTHEFVVSLIFGLPYLIFCGWAIRESSKFITQSISFSGMAIIAWSLLMMVAPSKFFFVAIILGGPVAFVIGFLCHAYGRVLKLHRREPRGTPPPAD